MCATCRATVPITTLTALTVTVTVTVTKKKATRVPIALSVSFSFFVPVVVAQDTASEAGKYPRGTAAAAEDQRELRRGPQVSAREQGQGGVGFHSDLSPRKPSCFVEAAHSQPRVFHTT